jgi:CPA2 family monovalent cation:H+ antiporter-2
MAQWAGLGLEIGAFLAGIVVSGTDYAHEVSSQINPLRDLFAALFFVSVGMMLQPAFLVSHALAIGIVVAAIVFGKSLITALAVYALDRDRRTSLLVGLGLAQVGEFSFVLAQTGAEKGLIPPEFANVIFSAAFITLLLCPFLYRAADPLYRRLHRELPAGEPAAPE